MKIKVYVAGVYSSTPDGEKASVLEVLKNISIGEKICAKLFKEGYAPYCPWHDKTYVMDNPFDEFKTEDFYSASLSWLEVSDCMLVISGKGLGSGVDKEIKFAEERNIPVFYEIHELKRYSVIQKEFDVIDNMTHTEMAYLYRFAPSSHRCFQYKELSDYFMKRFRDFGGMTTSISKDIGWGN